MTNYGDTITPVECLYINFGNDGYSAVFRMSDGSKKELPITITHTGTTIPDNDAVQIEDVKKEIYKGLDVEKFKKE